MKKKKSLCHERQLLTSLSQHTCTKWFIFPIMGYIMFRFLAQRLIRSIFINFMLYRNNGYIMFRVFSPMLNIFINFILFDDNFILFWQRPSIMRLCEKIRLGSVSWLVGNNTLFNFIHKSLKIKLLICH